METEYSSHREIYDDDDLQRIEVTWEVTLQRGDETDVRHHWLAYAPNDHGEWVFDYHDPPTPLESEADYGELEVVREEADEWVRESRGLPLTTLAEP